MKKEILQAIGNDIEKIIKKSIDSLGTGSFDRKKFTNDIVDSISGSIFEGQSSTQANKQPGQTQGCGQGRRQGKGRGGCMGRGRGAM